MDEVVFHECREVLDSFPGIWFVTVSKGEIILEASPNYHDRWSGRWKRLDPITLSTGSVVHWLIPKR